MFEFRGSCAVGSLDNQNTLTEIGQLAGLRKSGGDDLPVNATQFNQLFGAQGERAKAVMSCHEGSRKIGVGITDHV